MVVPPEEETTEAIQAKETTTEAPAPEKPAEPAKAPPVAASKKSGFKRDSECYIIEVRKAGVPKFDPNTGEKKNNTWNVSVPQRALASHRKIWPSIGIQEVRVVYDPTTEKG